jgi:diguanylate cyclase (GGDEF)-like protein
VLALLLLARWGSLIPGFVASEEVLGWSAWLLLTLACLLCLLHRPFSSSSLGLGALVVPVALLELGGAGTGAMVAAAALLADLVRRKLRKHSPIIGPERRRLVRSLENAGALVLAVLLAAVAGALALPDTQELSEATSDADPLRRLVVAGLVYGLALLAVQAGDKKLRRPHQPLPWGALISPQLYDLPAWAAGVAVALVGQAMGWPVAACLLAAFSLLSLEVARHALRHGISEQRIGDLERLSRASRRIAGDGREQGLVSVAERIRIECTNVIHFQWFQFELLQRDSQYSSWWAGPDRRLYEGQPEPPPVPPPLPGIHRRAAWQRLERSLETEDQLLGRLTLWCDPRQLESDSVALLDTLLPQMVASLQRAVLDREAKEDPLTGLAVRRVLEDRLLKAHRRCLQEGSSMAVVMCDLDHFKSINDTYGHAAGDQALIATAALLKEAMGEGQLAARYGGEEFTLLLEYTDGAEALELAEDIRSQVEALEVVWEGQRLPLTISLGIAVFPDLHAKAPEDLVELADEALYEAKDHGRNRCLLHLGRGRFRTVDGDTVSGSGDSAPAQPPQLFA